MRLIVFIVLILGGLFLMRKTLIKTFSPVEVAPYQPAPSPAQEASSGANPYKISGLGQSGDFEQNNVIPEQDPREASLADEVPQTTEVMRMKANISRYALHRFLKDTGFKFSSPFAFFEFSIVNVDAKTMVFETIENERGQQLILVVREGGDPARMILELASKKGYDLPSSMIVTNTVKNIVVEDGMNALYYATKTRRNAVAVVWVQPTQFNSQEQAKFSSSLK